MKKILIIVLFAFSIQAEIYKWTDENGKVHFSNREPPSQAKTIESVILDKKNIEKTSQKKIQNNQENQANEKFNFQIQTLETEFPNTLTANQLYLEYQNNEIAADLKYKNQNIELAGIIKKISYNIQNIPFVLFQVENEFEYIQCFFNEKWIPVLEKSKVGMAIKIKGIITGKSLLSILLKNCDFIDLQKPKPHKQSCLENLYIIKNCLLIWTVNNHKNRGESYPQNLEEFNFGIPIEKLKCPAGGTYTFPKIINNHDAPTCSIPDHILKD